MRKLVPRPDRIKAFRARHSWQEMMELTERIGHDIGELRSRGIAISGVGPDVLRNRVSILVVGLTAEGEAELRRRYGNVDVDDRDS